MLEFETLLLQILMIGRSNTQTTTPQSTNANPSACVVTGQDITFTACNGASSTIQSCESISSASGKGAFLSCFCQQGLFNDIYELRILSLSIRLYNNILQLPQ